MSIKENVLRLRDRVFGVSKIIELIENFEEDFRRKSNFLTESLNELRIRPTTVLIDEKTLLTRLFTGIKMYLDPQDLSVSAHIAVDGVWEYPITKAWLAILRENYTVFDIGANFGYFGLLAGQFTNKDNSKVVLFEANKNIVQYINKSVSVNWQNQNTIVENLAVSDKNGEVKLNVLRDFLGSSSLHPVEKLDSYMHKRVHFELSESLNVKSVTVDSYCENNNISELNLVKMDIEGYEDRAYSGMVNIVKNSEDITLFIEFTKFSYEKPKKFYDKMLNDFGNIYTISDNGDIVKLKNKSYERVIDQADDFVMLVFSKNPNLNRI